MTLASYILFLLAVAFVPMLFELRRSTANYRALAAAGAREPDDDVYAVMQIAYPASFVAMVVESWFRGIPEAPIVVAGALVFTLAKAIKYWAISTLGPRWTFRVIVPPRATLVAAGPYRYVRHPNYAGVMGELIGFGLLAGAPIAGVLAAAAFALILVARIRVEERALGLRSR